MSGVGQHRGVTESPESDNSEATGSVQDGHAQENPAAGPEQKTKRKMMKKKRGRVTSGTPSLTSETDIQAVRLCLHSGVSVADSGLPRPLPASVT